MVFYVDYGQGQYLGYMPSSGYSYNPATFQDVNFVAAPAPELVGINPSEGYPNLVTFVTIYGSNFYKGATAAIGEQQLVNVHVTQEGTVTGLLPSGMAPGKYDVTVTNVDGQSGVLEDGFRVLGETSGEDEDDDDGGCGCSIY